MEDYRKRIIVVYVPSYLGTDVANDTERQINNMFDDTVTSIVVLADGIDNIKIECITEPNMEKEAYERLYAMLDNEKKTYDFSNEIA